MRYVLVLLLLAGCVKLTPAERAERNVAKFGPACEIYGFTKGTPEFGNCIIQLRSNEIAASHAKATAAGVGIQTQHNIQESMQPK